MLDACHDRGGIPLLPSPREVARTYKAFFRFACKFNSNLCMSAPCVQVRTKRWLRCSYQPDPRPDRNANPNPTLWGARGLLSRSAGAVLSLRANLKTLHVWAIRRLVPFAFCFRGLLTGKALYYTTIIS